MVRLLGTNVLEVFSCVGSLHGLSLKFNIEDYEQIEEIGTNSGLKVLVTAKNYYSLCKISF